MEILKFNPIFKPTLWGSETWAVSAVKGSESIVLNGECKGMTLPEVVEQYGAEFLGNNNSEKFGNDFPLLIKFIDARQDLSIQVHPTDEIAVRQGRQRGKTEMWYLMDSDNDAKLYSGLKKQITPEEYTAMVENDTICDALAQYEVKEDDVFFLPAGRIHAIGTGCFLAEIQQTSDVTWRIYDFKRKDKNGNYRELHTKQASEAIDYTVESDYRTNYTSKKNQGVNLVSCPYFNTAVYDLDEPMTIDYEDLDSFVILIGLKGEGTVTDSEGNTTTLKAGETLLLPATEKTVKVEGTVKFLETYV